MFSITHYQASGKETHYAWPEMEGAFRLFNLLESELLPGEMLVMMENAINFVCSAKID